MPGQWAGLLGLCVVLSAGNAFAEPRSYTLPDETAQLRPSDSPGFQAAQGNCLTCHSVDYVAMQPPKKGKAFWESEVTKMIKVYHAPISEADSKVIAEYLSETY